MLVSDLIRKRPLSRGSSARTAVAMGDVRLSYAQFDERTDALARGFVAAGLAPGERAAILAHNSVAYLEVFFALAKAGAVAVPINYLLRGKEIDYHLDDAGVTWVFCDERFRALIGGDRRVVVLESELDALRGVDAALPHVKPTDLALLQYTSGTTGRPKAAMHTQQGVLLNATTQALVIPLREDDVYLCIPALCWAAGIHSILTAELFRGATVVLHPSSGFDPDRLCELIAAERATTLILVPVVLRAVLASGAFERHDVSSLRLILVGAEPVAVELLDRLAAALPDVEVVQGYGQSEFPTIMATLDSAFARTKVGSTGKAVGLTELRVIDDEGADRPPGEHGEIVCRSPATMLGYWDKPDATAETIVDGWLRTGDRGWMDADGFLYIGGRSKDMIISGGLNVYPAEVERVISEHPAVAECAVVGIEDERLGEVGRAFVVPSGEVSQDALAAYCREEMAGFKVPREWVIRAEPLPRTPSGKVQKFKL